MRRCAAALGLALAWLPCALGLNPEMDVSQYAHTAWKIRERFARGSIGPISQTPDGYLWLGTQFGLLRFDGVRTVAWQPPAGQHLPSDFILSLLAARDGTFWIGTANGLASWKDGKLTQYPELAGRYVHKLLEDRGGSVWAGANAVPSGRLCEIKAGSVQCHGGDGSLGPLAIGLHEDSKGNLWVGVSNGLWRWKPDPPKFYPIPDKLNGVHTVVETEDGDLLIPMRGAVKRLADGKLQAVHPFPAALRTLQAEELLRDRQGGLWIGTMGGGLVHVHHGRTDVFRQPDGLSGDFVDRLFEDREGSIWVTTNNGLDRFRDLAVSTLSTNQGLSNAGVVTALGAKDGSVWFSTPDSLNRWNNGQFTAYRERQGRAVAGVHEITGTGVPDHGLSSLFQDGRKRIWVSTQTGTGFLENDRFIAVSGLPGGQVNSIAEDTRGNLWLAYQYLGLYRLSPENEVQRIPWAALGRQDYAMALAADPLQGGLWLGFFKGGVAYFKDCQIRATYTTDAGLGGGRVTDLRFDRDGILWAATERGVSRLQDGRVSTLTSKNGLPCDTVHWVIEDDDRSSWLYTACGLARIAHSELEAWAAAPNHTIKVTVFDSSDGVTSVALGSSYSPHAARSADGRLWFGSMDGVSVVDPRHLPFNKLPPPVHVEQITADRKTYDAASGRLRLPPLARDLEIDYTALSFVAPEKIRFRYKLEGRDRDWQDAGNRRQAFYTDLPPRDYRFRVMASNNSGVWNEASASFDFSIAPAYYQATWFQLAIAAAALATLAGFYQLRVRYLKQQFNISLQARVGERIRIAREFHDTLLQSFQGVLLKLHAMTYRLPDHPEARTALEGIIEQARAAVTEGRDAVQGLRSSTVVANDLACAIREAGERLAAEQEVQNRPAFDVRVEGESRDLPPLVRDEVFRIAAEALRNSFRHAEARRIDVEIHYDKRRLRVRVRDDGKGIDPEVLDAGGRTGHHGMPGMQERAKLCGGKLAVSSELGRGTEIEVIIPGALAYTKSAAANQSAATTRGTE